MNVIDGTLTGQQLMEQASRGLSPRMKLKAKAGKNGKALTCPFGCTAQQHNAQGYCNHVVGCSPDGKTFEPWVKRGGRFVTVVKREKMPTGGMAEDGEPEFEWGDPQPEDVLPGDKLVTVTGHYLVYRDLDPAAVDKAARERDRKEYEAKKAKLDAKKLAAATATVAAMTK